MACTSPSRHWCSSVPWVQGTSRDQFWRSAARSMRQWRSSARTFRCSPGRGSVILENVADPTNVGAIFRSAGAIGADAILVTPRCSDPFYRRAIRVSMGTVLQVPWTRVGDWSSTRELLTRHGFHVAALALTPDAVSLRDFDGASHERLALVLGAEGPGLTDEALAASDTVVRIPMMHGIDSLNVAAASAVAMWALSG